MLSKLATELRGAWGQFIFLLNFKQKFHRTSGGGNSPADSHQLTPSRPPKFDPRLCRNISAALRDCRGEKEQRRYPQLPLQGPWEGSIRRDAPYMRCLHQPGLQNIWDQAQGWAKVQGIALFNLTPFTEFIYRMKHRSNTIYIILKIWQGYLKICSVFSLNTFSCAHDITWESPGSS